MKRVLLSCGHSCWVSWLSAFLGRSVVCPGTDGMGGQSWSCVGTPQTVLEVDEAPEAERVA